MQTQVTQLYVALFARAPESEGLGYWVNQLGNGATIDEVANAMFDSAPSRVTGYDTASGHVKPLYPLYLTNEQIVDSFYENVLGRPADAEGRAYWTAKMNEPGTQKGSIILEMIGDVVNYGGDDPEGLYSQGLFVNRVEVAKVWAMENGSLDGSVEILQGVTNDPHTGAAAIASIRSISGQTYYLEVGQDVVKGTAASDVFYADVAQNANGAQVNTLGSGDRIDGGPGWDIMNAEVAPGVFAGGSTSMPIKPRIESVETINLQAAIADIAVNGNNDVVYFNAKDVIGVHKLASRESDASLVVQNLTSQGLNHVSEMTIGMEYTGNADSMWKESDLHVYFDQDYLTTQRLLSRPGVDIQVMNEDAFDETNGDLPLAGVFFRELTFTLNGVRYDLTDYLGENPNGDGTEIQTYADALAAIGDALEALKADNPANDALQSMQVEVGPMFHADRNPDTLELREGTSIRLTVDGMTNGSDNQLVVVQTDLELARAAGATVENNNRYERADNEPPMEDSTLSINVDLEKVGRAGDGGELVIGSMNKTLDNEWGAVNTFTDTVSGFQEFNVTVHGTNDKSSSLSGLHSTNNNLRTVTIDSEGGNLGGGWADLHIGNSHTGFEYQDWDWDWGWGWGNWFGDTDTEWAGLGPIPSMVNQYALKDVQTLDASAFQGDLHVWAGLTEEIGPKYLDRMDGSPAPAAGDNVAFQYTGGVGNDYFNIAIDADNWADSGPATREDWSLTVDGGAGNDEIVVGMVGFNFGEDSDDDLANGHGYCSGVENWYVNQKMMHNVEIYGGNGDDVIRTMGSGDYSIFGGNGDDTIYVDNTGDRSIWGLNVLNNDIDDLLSDDNDGYLSWTGMKIRVSFHGFESTVDLAHVNGRTDDLAINQAVKTAINSDPVLSKLLVAEDGPGYSLVVKSLIDGDIISGDNWMLENLHDIQVKMVAPTTISAGDVAGLNAAWGTAYASDGVAALAALADKATTFNTGTSYNQETLEYGDWSDHVQDSIITGGLGDDVIVLGTGEDSNDTVVYEGFGNGTDSIVHFTAGSATETEEVFHETTYKDGVPESFKISFADLTNAGDGGTPPNFPVEITLWGGDSFNLGDAPQQGVYPGIDVAADLFAQLGGGTYNDGTTIWNVTHEAGSNALTFTAPSNGNVTPDIDVSNITFNAEVTNGATAVTMSDYVQGIDDHVSPTTESFTVDFAGTAATADGSFTWDGQTVNFLHGDGPLTLAQKTAAASYPNWDVSVAPGSSVVTFTATTPGDKGNPLAGAFSHGADGVSADVAVTEGTDGVAGEVDVPAWTETIVSSGMSGLDYIDFSAYGAKELIVDHFDVLDIDLSVGLAALGQKYITMVESETNAGEYTTKLWEVGADSDIELGLIGVLDFGDTMIDFTADNFIGIA